MLSLKGGVGKTTTTTTLGSTFSSLRGDRVIAVDANPDRGTLAQKIPRETTATVRHLLRDADADHEVQRRARVHLAGRRAASRCWRSEQDPAVSEAFSEDDYRRTVDAAGALLQHRAHRLRHRPDALGDEGRAGRGGLAGARVVRLGRRRRRRRRRRWTGSTRTATATWSPSSVAVINSVRPEVGQGRPRQARRALRGSAAVPWCRIPFDAHLEEGAEIELDRLAPETRLALLELAAVVADDFPQLAEPVLRPAAERGPGGSGPLFRSLVALALLVELAQELRVVVGRDHLAARGVLRAAAGRTLATPAQPR